MADGSKKNKSLRIGKIKKFIRLFLISWAVQSWAA
jgi:hypothetical protein